MTRSGLTGARRHLAVNVVFMRLVLLVLLMTGSGCCIEGYPVTRERDVTLEEIPARVREAFKHGYDLDSITRIEHSEFRSRCAGDKLLYRFHLVDGHSITLNQEGRLARWRGGIRRSRPDGSFAAATTQEGFQPLQYEYTLYLTDLQETLTISPAGEFRLTTRRGRAEAAVVEGLVPREVLAQLSDLLDGRDRHYPGVPDGGETTIRFGERTVTFGGGADIPEQVEKANEILRDFIEDNRGDEG